MFNRMILLVTLVAAIVLVVILNLTTPAGVGPWGVLLTIAMCYIVIFGLVIALMRLFKRVAGKGVLVKKDYYLAVVLAFGPIMILLLNAFSTLNLMTAGLVMMFVILTSFLVRKRM